MRVLWADDERHLLAATAEGFCERVEAEITFASTGNEALRQLSATPFDFCVIDMMIRMRSVEDVLSSQETGTGLPPKFAGPLICKHLRTLQPECRGVILSIMPSGDVAALFEEMNLNEYLLPSIEKSEDLDVIIDRLCEMSQE